MNNDRKTIFFDRDGTLIVDKIYLNDPDQITYLPGVFDSLRRLRDAGFQFIVVTNQSGVARGIVSIENLNEIHRRMQAEFSKHGVHFKGFYYAPFSVESNHPMRKPNPGMLLASARDHGVNLGKSWMVGDRVSDVVAGRKAGCRTVLLEGVEAPPSDESSRPTVFAMDIVSAADAILEVESRGLATSV